MKIIFLLSVSVHLSLSCFALPFFLLLICCIELLVALGCVRLYKPNFSQARFTTSSVFSSWGEKSLFSTLHLFASSQTAEMNQSKSEFESFQYSYYDYADWYSNPEPTKPPKEWGRKPSGTVNIFRHLLFIMWTTFFSQSHSTLWSDCRWEIFPHMHPVNICKYMQETTFVQS